MQEISITDLWPRPRSLNSLLLKDRYPVDRQRVATNLTDEQIIEQVRLKHAPQAAKVRATREKDYAKHLAREMGYKLSGQAKLDAGQPITALTKPEQRACKVGEFAPKKRQLKATHRRGTYKKKFTE